MPGGRSARQVRLLGDIVQRALQQLRPQFVEFFRCQVGTVDTVLAGAADGGLDDQLAQVLEHVGAVLCIAKPPGVGRFQRQLMAEKEFGDLRHIFVQCRVFQHAGAERVGNDHVAGPGHFEQAGHAEVRVGA